MATVEYQPKAIQLSVDLSHAMRETKFSYTKGIYYCSEMTYMTDDGNIVKGYEIAVDTQYGYKATLLVCQDVCLNGPYARIFTVQGEKMMMRTPKAPKHHFMLLNGFKCMIGNRPAILVRHNSKFVQLDSDGRSDIDQHTPPAKHVAYRRPISECPPTSSHHAMDSIELFFCSDTKKTPLGEIRIVNTDGLDIPALQKEKISRSERACCEVITSRGAGHLICSEPDMLFDLLIEIRRLDLKIRESINSYRVDQYIELNGLISLNKTNSKSLLYRVTSAVRLSIINKVNPYYAPNFRDLRCQQLADRWQASASYNRVLFNQLMQATTHRKINTVMYVIEKNACYAEVSDENKINSPSAKKTVNGLGNEFTTQRKLSNYLSTAESCTEDTVEGVLAGIAKIKMPLMSSSNSSSSKEEVYQVEEKTVCTEDPIKYDSKLIQLKKEPSYEELEPQISTIQIDHSAVVSKNHLRESLCFLSNNQLSSFFIKNN